MDRRHGRESLLAQGQANRELASSHASGVVVDVRRFCVHGAEASEAIMSDGLCGIPAFFARDGVAFRCLCKHKTGHEGGHSWIKYEQEYKIPLFSTETAVVEFLQETVK